MMSVAFFLYYGNRIGEYYRENPEMKGTYHRYRDNVGNGISYGVESTCSVDLSSFARVIHEDLKPEVYASVAVTGSRYLGQSRKQIEFVPLYNLKGGLNLNFRRFSAAVQVSGTSSSTPTLPMNRWTPTTECTVSMEPFPVSVW